MANTRFRNFVFTWNYQEQPTKEEVIEKFSQLGYNYLIASIETAKTGQRHLQGYCELDNQMRFNTIKKALGGIHFEVRKGTQKQAIDYVVKLGTTYDDGSTIESLYINEGEPKLQKEDTSRTDIEDFVYAIQEGKNDFELLTEYPRQFLLYQNKIQTIRNTMLEQKYARTFRELYVEYIYGGAGTGKSKYVFDNYPDAYKVNSYHSGAFDGYRNEDVLVLEEFRGNFPLSLLLQILDGYPLRLPARFNDKQACYTKVFIISNIALEEQYPNIDDKSLMALYRRINVIKYLDGKDHEKCLKDAVELFGKDLVKVVETGRS
ncbi:MAG: hypothetical protein QXI16_03185 [Sulfolobaceae archaeon]